MSGNSFFFYSFFFAFFPFFRLFFQKWFDIFSLFLTMARSSCNGRIKKNDKLRYLPVKISSLKKRETGREYLSNATRLFRRNIDVQLQISKLEHLGTQHQSSCIVKYITFRKPIRVRPIIQPNTVKTKTGCRLLQIRWCLRYSSQIPQLCSAISSRQPDLRELYFATLSVTPLDLYLTHHDLRT